MLERPPAEVAKDLEEQGTAGAVARIIVLDQFPRNVFRGSPRAFAYDLEAAALSRRVAQGQGVHEVHPQVAGFVYMPLMHSEGESSSAVLAGRLVACN